MHKFLKILKEYFVIFLNKFRTVIINYFQESAFGAKKIVLKNFNIVHI